MKTNLLPAIRYHRDGTIRIETRDDALAVAFHYLDDVANRGVDKQGRVTLRAEQVADLQLKVRRIRIILEAQPEVQS